MVLSSYFVLCDVPLRGDNCAAENELTVNYRDNNRGINGIIGMEFVWLFGKLVILVREYIYI